MKIATHDGIFHADDVFSVAILKTIFPESVIVRTRNLEILARCNYRVDVGGKYDSKFDFDHHQDLNLQAACTLVWYSYYEDFIKTVHGEGFCLAYDVEYIRDYVRRYLLDPVSGLDVNYTAYVSQNPTNGYLHVSQLIKDFNRIEMGEDIQLHRFAMAVDTAIQILKNCTYKAGRRFEDVKTIKSGKKIAEFATLYDQGFSYNDYRWEKGCDVSVSGLLVMPQSDETWAVVSMDTEEFNLSTATGEGLIFAHVGGFYTKWETQEYAKQFAEARSELRSRTIDAWAIEQNNGNGCRQI